MLLPHEPTVLSLIDSNSHDHSRPRLVAHRDPDVLRLVVGMVKQPGARGEFTLEGGTTTGWRLVTGGTAGVPDPALAWWREVPGRDTEAGGVVPGRATLLDHNAMGRARAT